MAMEATAWGKRAGDTLILLADSQRSIEKARVAMGNRMDASVREADDLDPDSLEVYRAQFRILLNAEEALESEMARWARQHPAAEWLFQVKGIGPNLGSKLLAVLQSKPPIPTKGPSSWFKLAGLNVVQLEPGGESHIPSFRDARYLVEKTYIDRDGNQKTRMAPTWRPVVRTICFLIGESFVRTGAFYRDLYDESKAALQQRSPDWPAWRIDRVARIKMVKIFLSHLYRVWAEAIGVTIPEPYPIAILGHSGIIQVPRSKDGTKI